jgi:hypothetical protein
MDGVILATQEQLPVQWGDGSRVRRSERRFNLESSSGPETKKPGIARLFLNLASD